MNYIPVHKHTILATILPAQWISQCPLHWKSYNLEIKHLMCFVPTISFPLQAGYSGRRPQEEKADSRFHLWNGKSAQGYQTMCFQTSGLFYASFSGLSIPFPFSSVIFSQILLSLAPYGYYPIAPPNRKLLEISHVVNFLPYMFSHEFIKIFSQSFSLGVWRCSLGKLQNSMMAAKHNSVMFVLSFLLTWGSSLPVRILPRVFSYIKVLLKH